MQGTWHSPKILPTKVHCQTSIPFYNLTAQYQESTSYISSGPLGAALWIEPCEVSQVPSWNNALLNCCSSFDSHNIQIVVLLYPTVVGLVG